MQPSSRLNSRNRHDAARLAECAAAVQPGPPPRPGLASALRVPDRARGLPWCMGQRRQRNPWRSCREPVGRHFRGCQRCRAAPRSCRARPAAVLDWVLLSLRTLAPTALEQAGSERAASAVRCAARRRSRERPTLARLAQPVPRLLRAARDRQQPEATRRGAARQRYRAAPAEPTHRDRWCSGACPRRLANHRAYQRTRGPVSSSGTSSTNSATRMTAPVSRCLARESMGEL